MELKFVDEKVLTHGNRKVRVKINGSPLGPYRRNLIVTFLDVAFQIVVNFETITPAIQCYEMYTAERWLNILKEYNSVGYANVSFGPNDVGKHMTLPIN